MTWLELCLLWGGYAGSFDYLGTIGLGNGPHVLGNGPHVLVMKK